MRNGFTLIELIISIFILSVSVVAIFSVFSAMTILTSGTADRLTATYLAQEGAEIVRNIRDTNWVNMNACASVQTCTPGTYTWLDGLNACTQGCELDYTTAGSGSSPVLYGAGYLNIDTNGFYSYKSGTSTKFKRKVIIAPVTDVDNKSDHILNVKVQVSWNRGASLLDSGDTADNCNLSNCITAEETLYDWYNYGSQ